MTRLRDQGHRASARELINPQMGVRLGSQGPNAEGTIGEDMETVDALAPAASGSYDARSTYDARSAQGTQPSGHARVTEVLLASEQGIEAIQAIAPPTSRTTIERPLVRRILAEVGRVVVGQEHMVERIMMALLTPGAHVLLEGPSGTAKTLVAHAFAQAIQGSFRRIQFNQDLTPQGVTGSSIFNQKTQEFEDRLGPIFANIVLCDEITRAPPGTQSGMLEAMEEAQVTIDGTTHPLPTPFFLIATQNSRQEKGTFPLPFAELDRFMVKVLVPYPTSDEMMEISRRRESGEKRSARPVATLDEILEAREEIRSGVYVDDLYRRCMIRIAESTRDPSALGVEAEIEEGAGPRGAIALIDAAKAHAYVSGRDYVEPEDMMAVAKDVLRHRIRVGFSEDQSTDAIVEEILSRLTLDYAQAG